MIKMFTAHTSEPDEIKEAILDLKNQINLQALEKYSVGIVFCHMDFIETGFIKELSSELPFEIIGMTSVAQVDNNGCGIYELTLTVLTSSDVSFETGMTGNIDHDNFENEIDVLYKQLREKSGCDPSVIITFMPYTPVVSGYEMLLTLDRSCGGIPIWGSLTNNVGLNFNTVGTVYNGNCKVKGGVMLLLNGPVTPRFILSSIPERNISNNRALVTKCKSQTVIQEVNGIPVLEYLVSVVGLKINADSIITTPILAYYENSEEPVVLGLYSLLEDGSLVVGGELPEGTLISPGIIDPPGIFESGEEALGKILECRDRQATLILPCVTRYIMLSPDQEGEMRKIKETLSADGHPFAMGYSGGEMCPVPDSNGKLHNRFHSYTFIACVL